MRFGVVPELACSSAANKGNGIIPFGIDIVDKLVRID